MIICEFKFVCDKQWSKLAEIEGEEYIRYCDSCEKPVFYCNDYEELESNVAKGRCIAVCLTQEPLQRPTVGSVVLRGNEEIIYKLRK